MKIIVDQIYVNTKDYPDFVDSYIISAYYEESGEYLTDIEIDELNENSDFLYNECLKYVY